jgi:hypothetical protein
MCFVCEGALLDVECLQHSKFRKQAARVAGLDGSCAALAFAGSFPLAVNDSSSVHDSALAEQLDARFAAAVAGVKQLGGLFQVSHSV